MAQKIGMKGTPTEGCETGTCGLCAPGSCTGACERADNNPPSACVVTSNEHAGDNAMHTGSSAGGGAGTAPHALPGARLGACRNFLVAIDAKDVPVSLTAAFYAGWDARERRLANETSASPGGPLKVQPGDWIDSWGACKVCGGEIPDGHTSYCAIWIMEQQRDRFRDAL